MKGRGRKVRSEGVSEDWDGNDTRKEREMSGREREGGEIYEKWIERDEDREGM